MQRALGSGHRDAAVPSCPQCSRDHVEGTPGQDPSPPSPHHPRGQANSLLEWLQQRGTDSATTATVRPTATWQRNHVRAGGRHDLGRSCPPSIPCHPSQLLSHGFTLPDLLDCATHDDLFYLAIRYPQPTLPFLAWPGWRQQGGRTGGGDAAWCPPSSSSAVCQQAGGSLPPVGCHPAAPRPAEGEGAATRDPALAGGDSPTREGQVRVWFPQQ